jgi:hypothetical protein
MFERGSELEGTKLSEILSFQLCMGLWVPKMFGIEILSSLVTEHKIDLILAL